LVGRPEFPHTRKWIEEQATFARAYFAAIPTRRAIRQRVSELLSIPAVAEPWNVGDRCFFLKHRQDREQPLIVVREGLFGEETVLVDPALREADISTSVAIAAISFDGRFLAYSVRKGGSDYAALEVFDIERHAVLTDRLPEGFCTGIVFAPDNSGFYYSHRKLRDPRPNYRAVFWHRFGTERSEDQEVFFAGEKPNLFIGIRHSPEDELLAFAVFSTGKHPSTSVHLQPMCPGAAPKLLFSDIKAALRRFS